MFNLEKDSMKKNEQKIFTVIAMALIALSSPLYGSETDTRIETAFNESYVAKTYLKDDAVKAESKDGVVTLSGTVDQEAHKGLAQETAQNLPDVKSVDNRLELKGDHPAEKSNEWIALKVRTALLFHQNVNAAKTDVYVEEGIVTLRGEAASEAQKELTSEYVKDVSGIEGIKNEMTVAKDPNAGQTMKEKIDDASITAQVKMALLTHHSTSALKTSVATKEGVVTLSGNAQNDAEKALVTKLVSDIFGVQSTVNNMSVNVPKTN
jgi:hyperosmotically inducible periplasmic protein